MNGKLVIYSTTVLALVGVSEPTNFLRAAEGGFEVAQQPNQVQITHAGKPVATYVFRDEKIRRPYFSNLHAPGGIQVTRNHPPIAGQDAMDHDTMHPGLWLAFGDVSGQDFWRNKAEIEHARFLKLPIVTDGQVVFATENRFVATDGRTVCTQLSDIRMLVGGSGFLLIWEAAFKSDEGDFAFGDQEEMGLGVRVATAITEKNGGLITASTGAKTAKATWGKAFDWCDYSGAIGDRRPGITLMPDPANFRPSWFHNRDYGLMVANPFGRNAMKQGEASQVTVKKGETFRLRFGVLLHASPVNEEFNPAEACKEFQRFK